MKGTIHPKVKICCISSIEEAKMAIERGAAALGLVSQMPSGPGILNDETILQITQVIPDTISTFLLTCETIADRIIEQHNKFRTDTIQLVDEVSNDELKKLRTKLPEVNLIQVIHVIDESAIPKAIAKSKMVDAILLDSGNPLAKIKTLGGTGTVHNWEISRKIRKEMNVPLWLAGGLNSENVNRAIEEVQPYGIDLCSGVRTDEQLDYTKLNAFFNAVNSSES